MIDMTPTPSYGPEETVSVNSRIHNQPSGPWNFLCNSIDMQEIIPGIFLGSYSAAQVFCLTNLLEKGIRYIVCVRTEAEATYMGPQIQDPAFTYLTLDIADKETENIMIHFPEVNQFIDEALRKNSKVLIHGNNGNSRSASLVLAYVMQKFGLSFNDALCLVKTKRASVEPNIGFKAQLFEYEPIYKARQRLSYGGCSSTCRPRPKRKLEHFVETDAGPYDCSLVPPPPSPVLCEGAQTTGTPTQREFANNLSKLLLTKR